VIEAIGACYRAVVVPELFPRMRALNVVVVAFPLHLVTTALPLRAQYTEIGVRNVVSIPGRTVGDLFGWRVRALGDVTADGIPDFAVAAPFDQLNIGRVSVHSGRDGALVWGNNGPTTSSILGFDLATVGDLDGDRVREVVAGGPFAAGSGIAYVWSGRTGAVLQTLQPPTGGDSFGECLATGGDYNGDGVEDIAISDPGNSTSGARRGQVFVFSSAGFGLVRAIAPPAGGFLFGATLGFVGDTNGDGRDEIAIGDRVASTGPAGQLHLVGFDGTSDVVRWTVGGTNYGSDIDGNKVDGGGDVDGDGVPDVMLDESTVHRARLLSGATGGVIATLSASSGNYGKGAKIVDDQNHDGVPDLLVGATNDSTSVHWGGRVVLLSGRDRRLLRSFTGTVVDALLGRDQELIADVSGDGFPDLLFGASGASGFTRSMGSVRVVEGDRFLAGRLVYGDGVPGTAGTPTFVTDVDPQLGVLFQLVASSSAPGTAAGLCVLGFAQIALPLPGGSTLLADPATVLTLSVPAAGFAVPLLLPVDPQLLGRQLFAQLFVVDAGAAGGVAASAGLRVTFGR
jgi:hypothetical protein